MEIDARFPAIPANQPVDARDGQEPTLPPAALVGAGSESEFFISPVLTFDSRSLTVIFQVRDSRSGDVVRQFPPEAVVERYRQDPTAKPFVLSPRSASGQDDTEEGSEADLLAPFPEPGERPVPPSVSDSTPAPAQSTEASGPAPVDLVA